MLTSSSAPRVIVDQPRVEPLGLV